MDNPLLDYYSALHTIFENVVSDIETKLEESDDGEKHPIRESRNEVYDFLSFQISELQQMQKDLLQQPIKIFLDFHGK